ncbi:MAG TPA: EamA family transporter [Actinomycetes bacterium]|nr:EamA family transporter [Actinomycetes bacterium]
MPSPDHPATVPPLRVADRVPAQGWFVVSAVFHYLGPAFAVLLFARVDVLGVAWLRIATAGLVLALWRRPWRRWAGLDPGTRRLVVAWGAVLAAMNGCFYLAIDRLPLGTVAAVEFVPVLALAAVGARTRRNGVALLLAAAGVALLTEVRLVEDPVGVAFAVANAGLFAAYVVLGHQVACSTSGDGRDGDGNDGTRGIDGIDGLALSMGVALLVALPVGLRDALPAMADPALLAAAVGVGVASSVVPYVCDQLAMARMARATYSLMLALLPATATVVGVLVLTQLPTAKEAAGVALVVGGVAVHRPPVPVPSYDGAGSTQNSLPEGSV